MRTHDGSKSVIAFLLLAVAIARHSERRKPLLFAQGIEKCTAQPIVIEKSMDIRTKDADVGHEASIGRISDESIFYLMSRGISEEDAKALIVSGFADNVSKELPLEYAVEMNNLIRLEMIGSIG